MLNISFARRGLLAAFLAFAAAPAFAHDAPIHVKDAYAFETLPTAMSAAAYLVIENHSDAEDRLISVRGDVAQRIQVHTNKEDSAGVMKMTHLIDGILIPAGEAAELKSGGDHVMFMGLTKPFVAGESFPLILLFQKAGEVVVDVQIVARDADAPASAGCPSHGEEGEAAAHEGHESHEGAAPAAEAPAAHSHH